jgi:predicted unusual protein kinase regulating ubiquinone biosynthesis (AarF/ABC1/UbiB family)
MIYTIFTWIYFILKISFNFKWITTTLEGGLYLKKCLINLGIIGIKLGQYLYTQRYILNNNVRNTLESLLSHNKVHTPDETIKMISFDKSNKFNLIIDQVKYNEVLGSGSLAQTYICYLKNDQKKYVLKVSHPDVLKLKYEINILKYIVKIISYFKKININWNDFFNNLLEQCDLTIEGDNIIEFNKIYKNYDKIEIPQLVYSHKYFIIMSFCEGISMNKLNRSSKEYLLATNLVASSFLHSSYKYNIVHGDLHQGNILVKENGSISLIDFGICKRIKSENNDILYVYEDFVYNLNFTILEKITKLNLEQQKISFELGKKFIIDYNVNMPKDIDPDAKNMYFLPSLGDYCFINNIVLDSDVLYFIMNLILLESYTKSDKYNGNILLRTLSYMKRDKFFMDEMGEYVLKFYELEHDNEDKLIIKIRYP